MNRKEAREEGSRIVPTPELLAKHEAAHVVAALALDVGVIEVTIEHEGTWPGHTSLKGPGRSVCDSVKRGSITPDVRKSVEPYIMSAFAGPIAEERLQSMGAPCAAHIEKFSDGAREDLAKANRWVRHLNPNNHGRDKADEKRLWVETEDLLACPKHWASVKALAEALLEEKTISGECAQEIVEEASRRHQA